MGWEQEDNHVLKDLRSGHFYDLAKYNCARQGLFRLISQIWIFFWYYSLRYSQTNEMIVQDMWLQYTYCKFFTFTSDSNSSDLLVLLLHELYIQSLPQLRHFSYRATIFCIACWQNSVSCVIDHRSATGFAWQSSLCLFCFSAVKENFSVDRAIDKTLRSVCYFLIDSHKNYVRTRTFINRSAGSDIPDCRGSCCLSVCL